MKRIILAIALLSIGLNCQGQKSMDEILSLLQKGEINKTEAKIYIGLLEEEEAKTESTKVYEDYAKEYLENNTGGPEALSIGGAFSWLGKAFKWLKEKEVNKLVSYLFNPECKDMKEIYEQIGKHVVETQINEYLISIGSKPIATDGLN